MCIFIKYELQTRRQIWYDTLVHFSLGIQYFRGILFNYIILFFNFQYIFNIFSVSWQEIKWWDPDQYTPFFYTRTHLSELPSCKSIISTEFFTFSYLNSAQHISVIELCCQIFFKRFYRKLTHSFSYWFFGFYQ